MVERYGNWAYSIPIALNNRIGTPATVSPTILTPEINVTPMLIEYNVEGVDPSGSRHIHYGSGVPEAFIGVRASGSNPASLNFGDFDMNSINISPGSGISCARVFLFRAEQFDCHTTRIHNIRLWASSTSDFLTPDSFRIVYEKHNAWASGLQFPTNYLLNESKFLPTSLPESLNLSRTNGGSTIHGSGDADVSQWVYMAVAASGTLPLAQYGSTSASGFLLRTTFEIDNLTPLFD